MLRDSGRNRHISAYSTYALKPRPFPILAARLAAAHARRILQAMDHLWIPQNPQGPLIEVPCFSTEEYDGKALESYPERQGWKPRPEKEWQDVFDHPTRELQELFQTWLFFGPIQMTFRFRDGTYISRADLSRAGGSPSERVVDTSAFPRLLTRWLVENLQINNQVYSSQEEHIEVQNPIQFASLMMTGLRNNSKGSDLPKKEMADFRPIPLTLSNFMLSNWGTDPLDPRIPTSIDLLVDFLLPILFNQHLPGSYENFRSFGLTQRPLLSKTSSLLVTKMQSDGWCPYQISMLYERLTGPAFYFVSYLARPNPEIKHRTAKVSEISNRVPDNGKNASQQTCTDTKCAMNVRSIDEYTTEHADQCNGCQIMTADRDSIHAILRAGSYPLITILPDDQCDLEIPVIACSEGQQYVAISHVWSDGLGNPRGNSLPRCQIIHLSNFIRELCGSVSHFWLDTICVPPDADESDIESQEAQELAIGRMRETYEDATSVLVLDSWLLSTRIRSMDDTEILLRILSCGWNTRLWTLQEGALARRLYFQFKDRTHDSDTELHKFLQKKDYILDWTLKPIITQRYHELRGFRENQDSASRFTSLVHTLKVRSTSQVSDEAICLAALLDLDILQIIQSEPDERMKTFWKLVKILPSTLVFYGGQKRKEPGLRWAPRSLLRREHTSDQMDLARLPGSIDGIDIGYVTPFGFLIRYPALLITVPGRWFIGHDFTIRCNNHQWYCVVTHMKDIEGSIPYRPYEQHSSMEYEGYKFNPWYSTSDQQSGMIDPYESLIPSKMVLIMKDVPYPDIRGGVQPGILTLPLIPVTQTSDHVETFCPVTVCLINPNSESGQESIKRHQKAFESTSAIDGIGGDYDGLTRCLYVVGGELTETNRLWIVD